MNYVQKKLGAPKTSPGGMPTLLWRHISDLLLVLLCTTNFFLFSNQYGFFEVMSLNYDINSIILKNDLDTECKIYAIPKTNEYLVEFYNLSRYNHSYSKMQPERFGIISYDDSCKYILYFSNVHYELDVSNYVGDTLYLDKLNLTNKLEKDNCIDISFLRKNFILNALFSLLLLGAAIMTIRSIIFKKNKLRLLLSFVIIFELIINTYYIRKLFLYLEYLP